MGRRVDWSGDSAAILQISRWRLNQFEAILILALYLTNERISFVDTAGVLLTNGMIELLKPFLEEAGAENIIYMRWGAHPVTVDSRGFFKPPLGTSTGRGKSQHPKRYKQKKAQTTFILKTPHSYHGACAISTSCTAFPTTIFYPPCTAPASPNLRLGQRPPSIWWPGSAGSVAPFSKGCIRRCRCNRSEGPTTATLCSRKSRILSQRGRKRRGQEWCKPWRSSRFMMIFCFLWCFS